MDSQDLLVKEYEAGWKAYQQKNNEKHFSIRFFILIVVASTTLITKSTLSEQVYILLALLFLFFLFHFLCLDYEQNCLKDSLRITELKFRQLFNNGEFPFHLFDLPSRYKYLLDGNKKSLLSTFSSLSLVVGFFAASIFVANKSISVLTLQNSDHYFCLVLYIVVEFLFLLCGLNQNKKRKERYKSLINNGLIIPSGH